MEKHFYGQNILIENALRFFLKIYLCYCLAKKCDVQRQAWYNSPMNIFIRPLQPWNIIFILALGKGREDGWEFRRRSHAAGLVTITGQREISQRLYSVKWPRNGQEDRKWICQRKNSGSKLAANMEKGIKNRMQKSWIWECAGNPKGCWRVPRLICSVPSSWLPISVVCKRDSQLWLGFSKEPALSCQWCLEY